MGDESAQVAEYLLVNSVNNEDKMKNSQSSFADKSEGELPSPPLFGSCRLTLTVLSFFGVYHLMALRFNISMALVCMSSDPTHQQLFSDNVSCTQQRCIQDWVNTSEETLESSPPEDSSHPEFSWSKPLQGAILSSFFYGYILTQVPGGYLSDRWGGRTVLLCGMLILSVGSLVTPLAARLDPRVVVCVRIVQGLASGFAFPSIYNIFTAWAPPVEKATLMSISFAGIPTATVTIYPLVSWFCQSSFLGGWPLAFYIPGATGLVWCLLFSQLIYNTPAEHPRISTEELLYLTKDCVKEKQKHVVPWREIVRSVGVHALCITHLCSTFGWYLVVINISLFIREALGFRVIHNGFLSMLPSLGMLCLSTTGKLFDHIRSRSSLSVTYLRKIFNSIAFFVPALCFLTLGLLDPDFKIGHVALVSLGLSVHELAMTGGFYFSHSELAGPHSGVIFGITNTFAQIPGFVTPIMVSYVTQNGSLEEWYVVFRVAGVIYIIGGLIYLVFGTSELQYWARNRQEGDVNRTKDDV